MRKTVRCFLAALLLAFAFGGCSGKGPPAAGYEEGVSAADSIVNAPAAEKVILVVSFGTSYNQSRGLTIGGIEAAIKSAYPDYGVRRAFTSQIIIDKLAERDKLNVDNVTQAMNRLVLDRAKEVIIQPTTVMNGFEYDDIIAEVTPFADKFESLKIGKHLLCDDEDYSDVAEILIKETSKFRSDGTAAVFMGHGTEHAANAAYERLQEAFRDKGCADCIIGTVEAEPSIDDVRAALKAANVKKVVLRPLMVVAGDHANNDMAGDGGDSWKGILTADGYAVETVLEGLGQIKAIQDIYVRHVQNAINGGGLKAEAAPDAGVSAYRLKDGVYPIEAATDSSMFRVASCLLKVENGAMTADVTLSGQGFEALYVGTARQAAESGAAERAEFALAGGKHVFSVPVAALDVDISCAALGVKSGSWYDHIIAFKSDGIPDGAFLPREINVKISGGSGRASVSSPAALTRKGGTDCAEIVWSSPNYVYMLSGGAKYLPVNTGGNSVFEIPIVFDQDMAVTACTVAMSEPKEIEYTLNFDSSSIRPRVQ